MCMNVVQSLISKETFNTSLNFILFLEPSVWSWDQFFGFLKPPILGFLYKVVLIYLKNMYPFKRGTVSTVQVQIQFWQVPHFELLNVLLAQYLVCWVDAHLGWHDPALTNTSLIFAFEAI
jgi:hypothetical protein